MFAPPFPRETETAVSTWYSYPSVAGRGGGDDGVEPMQRRRLILGIMAVDIATWSRRAVNIDGS